MDAVVLRGRLAGRYNPPNEPAVSEYPRIEKPLAYARGSVLTRAALQSHDHEGVAGSGLRDGTSQTAAKRPNLLAGEDLPPHPRQKRSLEKRARLKAAALALFGDKGYEGASIEEISRRAKLPVGGFYLHFRSKRQLLLALMDELLERLTQLDLRPKAAADVRAGLRQLLSRAFSADLRYLGACRAWEEAVLSDPDLARRQKRIRSWTTMRVTAVFTMLQQLPRARPGVDFAGLARVMDSFFWSLLAQAVRMREAEINDSLDSATHLIYHALFTDAPPMALPKHRRKKPSVIPAM